MKKKIFILVVFLFSLFALVGCGEVVEGPQGPAGAKGANGKSAYEIAVDNGFNGTEEAWLESLHGEDGDPGLAGLQGPQGEQGPEGEAAKQISMFVDDGGVYWCLEGEDPELLYYYLDYITVSYKYPAQYSSLEEIKAGFLADVNSYREEPIEADEFYATYSEKFMNVTAVNNGEYSINGFCVEHELFFAKWKWLIQFIGGVMGDKKYGNTALVAFGLKSANDDNLVTGTLNYADRTITNSIDNFLNGTDDVLHGGSSSGAVPADFTTEAAYEGIMEAYYAGIQSIKDVQVPRSGYKTYQFLTDETEPLVAAAFDHEKVFFNGWTDADGKEITSIPSNHSVNVYLSVKPLTAVYLKAGDGGAWIEDITAAVLADFLAEFNASAYKLEVDPTNAKELCALANSVNIYNFMAADAAAETPNWKWLAQYLSSLNSYKSEVAAIAAGTAVVDSPADTGYQTTYELFNFFTGKSWKGEYENGADANGREIAFWKTGYGNIGSVAPAKYFVAGEAVKAIVALGLPQPISDKPFLGWYLEGDAEQALVKSEDMVMDGNYVAKYLSAEQKAAADAILAEFLADINTASGLNATAATFFATYKFKLVGNGTSDSDWVNEGGVFQAHPELVTEWGWLIELAQTGNLDNKRVLGACQAINVPYAYTGSSSATFDYHSATMFANNISNILNYSGATTHTGSASTYPASDWSNVAQTVLAILAAQPAE